MGLMYEASDDNPIWDSTNMDTNGGRSDNS